VQTAVQAILESWRFPPLATTATLITSLVYARGFRILHRQMPMRFPLWRLAAFISGMALMLIAVASPLDALAYLLLQVHMTQHLLLMLVAPPMILLGAPAVPLLRGLPLTIARDGIGPFLRWRAFQRFWRWLTYPATTLLLFAVATWSWHVPILYELALRSSGWHAAEHLCFFGSAMLFWYPVVQPWPSRPAWPRWAMAPYLLFGEIQNMVLSAVLTFSDRVIYPSYGVVPRLDGITALGDQIAAGAIMWVPGSLFFLVPAVAIILTQLAPARMQGAPESRRFTLPLRRGVRVAQWDFLRLPIARSVLIRPLFRRMVQAVLFTAAVAVILDGLFGPNFSPLNLAGPLPWIYWRAFLVIGLLAAGNLFCFSCPFTFARDLARRVVQIDLSWPHWLRTKWIAVVLLCAFLYSYEAFDLWSNPRSTALIIISYFALAVIVDVIFSGAAFCKYVCPIGQYQFVQSWLSPLTLRPREVVECTRCKTHDCLRGNQNHRGCELGLFMPRKAGNFECTLCLDCVRACPHDNIGLFAAPPGTVLIKHEIEAPSVMRAARSDLVALASIAIFGAFAAAAAMIAPVHRFEAVVDGRLNLPFMRPAVLAFFAVSLLAAPFAAVTMGAALNRFWAQGSNVAAPSSRRFVYALLPLGLSMWAAHFLFHLFTGLGAAYPLIARVARIDGPGWPPASGWTESVVDPLNLSFALLDVGLLMALYFIWRVAKEHIRPVRAAVGIAVPWVTVALILYLTGIWTMLQPMPMRDMIQRTPADSTRMEMTTGPNTSDQVRVR
jgi:cytochrome c oxidase assembly factor CtaG/polyferredoxin